MQFPKCSSAHLFSWAVIVSLLGLECSLLTLLASFKVQFKWPPSYHLVDQEPLHWTFWIQVPGSEEINPLNGRSSPSRKSLDWGLTECKLTWSAGSSQSPKYACFHIPSIVPLEPCCCLPYHLSVDKVTIPVSSPECHWTTTSLYL